MESNKRIISAFFWKFIERSGSQVSAFVVTIVLARILTPQDYGVVALIVVFTSIASTFVQGGFNTALIQTKHASNDDFVTIFWFTIAIATFIYALLFSAAPIISKFYKLPVLTPIMRVLSLILFPATINSIQLARVTRDLNFKILSISTLFAIIISAIFGICLAILGFGPWALVAQQLVNQIAVCFNLYVFTRWIPRGRFQINSIARLVPFGSRVLLSDLLIQIFLNIRSLVIGRLYSATDLGYFNRGNSFPQTVMESINGTVQSVLLPVYAKKQENRDSVINMLRTTIRSVSFITVPLSLGLACVAKPVVQILLTDKWLMCVPYIQIFSVGYIFYPAQNASSQAFKALGDSRTSLRIEIIRKAGELLLLLISMRYGVLAIAYSTLAGSIIGAIATIIPNARLIHYSVRQQLLDIMPSLLLSLLMGGVVLAVNFWISFPPLLLTVQMVIAALLYFSMAKLFHVKEINFLFSNLKMLLGR